MVQHSDDPHDPCTPGARTPHTPHTPHTPWGRGSHMCIKVIDFGLAVYCRPGHMQTTVVGTKYYVAPEVLRGSYDLSADVWSAGVIFHTLLVGQPPSDEVCAGGWGAEQPSRASQSLWAGVSNESKLLIQDLLQIDPSYRLTSQAASRQLLALSERWEQCGTPERPSFGSPNTLSAKHATRVMKQFVAFHRSQKLRQAALTAIAMQLTDSQIRGLREQFLAIDTNHDGQISLEELQEAMAHLPPSGRNMEGWLASVFDSVDTDGNGSIDYSEFCAAALREGTYRCEQSIQAAFRVFDQDGNGQISRVELAAVIQLEQQGVDLDQLLSEWDSDGDGELSYDEFRAMVLNLASPESSPLGRETNELPVACASPKADAVKRVKIHSL